MQTNSCFLDAKRKVKYGNQQNMRYNQDKEYSESPVDR